MNDKNNRESRKGFLGIFKNPKKGCCNIDIVEVEAKDKQKKPGVAATLKFSR